MKIILLIFSLLSLYWPVGCQSISQNHLNNWLSIKNSQISDNIIPIVSDNKTKDNIDNLENIIKEKSTKIVLEYSHNTSEIDIESDKNHFATNVSTNKFTSSESMSSYSLGIYIETKQNENIKYIFGLNSHYGNYKINFKYEFLWSSFSDIKYVHKIKSIHSISPVAGINLYSNYSRLFNFYFTGRIGIKLIDTIKSEKIFVNLENNRESKDSDAKKIDDNNDIYLKFGIGILIKKLSVHFTYIPELYNLRYSQDGIYLIQGTIFKARVSVFQIGASLLF